MNKKKTTEPWISFKYLLLLLIGTLLAAIGLRGFLIPNRFIDGGVTGVALILREVFHIPLSITLFALNVPFIFLAYKQISKRFAFRTFIGISFLALWLLVVQIAPVTQDSVLIAVFGGLLLGLGLGIAIRSGAVIDGTEILALTLARASPVSIGDTILMINLFIFSAAAFIFGIEPAMYSVLTYFTVSKTVDFVVSGIEEYTGVTVISDQSDEVRKMILEKMGRGVTVYSGKRGLSNGPEHQRLIDVLFTVVTRLELVRMKNEISAVDEKAVIIEHTVNDIHGGVVKRRKLRLD